MLSRSGVGVDGRPTVSARRRAIVAAVAPTARVAHLGAAAMTVAFAAVPALVTVARGDPVVSAPLVVASLVGGAALGWAADDPAAELLGSMPLSSPLRLRLRGLLVATVAALGVAATVLLVAVGPGLPGDLTDRVPEAAAAAALALAIGLVAARRGERQAGPIGVTAGLLAPTTVAVLAYRWPAVLPSYLPSPAHVRWWIVAAIAGVIAARAGRDPARR